MGFENCGIQEPIKIGNLFHNYGEQNRAADREKVMDRWLEVKIGVGLNATKAPGRVLRRMVQNKIFRYQCQYASDTAGFGFSKKSIEEDIARGCKIVIFKQEEPDSKVYKYCEFYWEVKDDILYAKLVTDGNEFQTFKNWKMSDRVVVNATTKEMKEGVTIK